MKNHLFSNRILLAGILILSAAFVSCSKDEALTENEQLLTSGKWLRTIHVVDPPLPVTDENDVIFYVGDLHAYLGECYDDDIFIFNPDKSLVLDEGSLKCDETSVQKETGEWYFGENEATLILEIRGVPETFIVQELTAETLILKYTSNYIDNIEHINTMTFSH